MARTTPAQKPRGAQRKIRSFGLTFMRVAIRYEVWFQLRLKPRDYNEMRSTLGRPDFTVNMLHYHDYSIMNEAGRKGASAEPH
jgi:hypothetical protein